MSVFERLKQFFRPPRGEGNAPGLRVLARTKHFFRHLFLAVGEEYWNGLLTLQAMGLVYTTLLSLVPFLAVAFSVLKAFGVQQQVEPFLMQAFAPLGPQGDDIARRIIDFVNNLRVGVLGTLGLAGLFFTVFSLLSQVEGALNYIWKVRRSRSLARKFSDYFSLALVGPVLVFTAFALIASAQNHALLRTLLQTEYVGTVVAVATRIAPFIFLCTAFTLVYKLIPYTRVSFVSALVGGITAGILWQLASAAFAAFVSNSVYYTAVYSSFAILIVFFFWLYIGWVIVLVGGVAAYVYQHPYTYLRWASWRRQGHIFRTWLALSALTEITRRHLEEKSPWRLTELSSSLNVSTTSLEELIDEFVRSGILFRTAEPEGITLGRPPEQVTICEIFDTLDGSDPTGAEPAAGHEDRVALVLHHRTQALQRAFAGVTLRTLASDADSWRLPSPEPAPFREDQEKPLTPERMH